MSGTSGGLLDWTDDLLVNVPFVDDQHREIFKRLREFRQAQAAARSTKEVERALRFLVDYVIEHFVAEEKLMTQHRYPAAAHHKSEHTAFTMLLRDFVTCYCSSGMSTLLELQIEHRWESWLINHIKKGDREFAKFVKSRTSHRASGRCPSASAPADDVPPGARGAGEEDEQRHDAQRDERRGGHEHH